GQLSPVVSSARFKEDVRNMDDSSGGLMQLRPVRFHYKKDIDPSGLEQYGLIAEEVAKIYPNLVVYDEQGQPRSVRYHFVNAMLLNEVQKQARQIADLERQLALERQEAKTQVDSLASRLAQIETVIGVQGRAAILQARGGP